MDSQTSEQELRREAIRRRLAGERRCNICTDLQRSPSWFSKWWAEYQENPQLDCADRSRVPQTSPQQTSEEMVQSIVSIRRTLEAAATPETRYGLIGPRAIQTHLEALRLNPPSRATIQRILQAHGLTHPIGAGKDSAYYPWLDAWAVNAIQATDIITKHIRGGEKIENFHTIDHYSHTAFLSQCPDKTSAATNILNVSMFLPTIIATTHNSNCKPLTITPIGTVTNGANLGLRRFITSMKPPGQKYSSIMWNIEATTHMLKIQSMYFLCESHCPTSRYSKIAISQPE